MRIICSTLSYWHTPDGAKLKKPHLERWRGIVDYLFRPTHKWITSGTISDPSLNPIPDVPLVTAGVPYSKAYDVMQWSYAMCALEACFAHALNIPDWDFLVLMDDELLVGDINCDALFREFDIRNELVLSNSWHGFFCGCFSVYKRAALVRYLYESRLRPALMTAGVATRLIEQDFEDIFSGAWWNPWPHIYSMRQDFGYDPNSASFNEEEMSWPFIRLPHPAIVDSYLNTQWPKAKPVA
ncbi:MAG: hypothetical protein WC655_03485 [Candidatus Hydrogenedentales bacterium]|jgi:hypothetical protein